MPHTCCGKRAGILSEREIERERERERKKEKIITHPREQKKRKTNVHV
tara:strand:- start:165 stop:308 length:144 start_codon:yes stop_codon:yes gene_type:complete